MRTGRGLLGLTVKMIGLPTSLHIMHTTVRTTEIQRDLQVWFMAK